MCGVLFWEGEDEDLVFSSFSHCKLKYSGPTYFIVYIIFIMIS